MRFSSAQILAVARPDGFDAGVVEMVLHLVHLLNVLDAHPLLRGRWVLKGGTALNLFVLRHPRLSVDIDLNYIGAPGREDMLADRPGIEQAAQAVFSREGFAVRRVPNEHAGGKWRLSYQSFTGQPANLESFEAHNPRVVIAGTRNGCRPDGKGCWRVSCQVPVVWLQVEIYRHGHHRNAGSSGEAGH